jgi:hypothetical protein
MRATSATATDSPTDSNVINVAVVAAPTDDFLVTLGGDFLVTLNDDFLVTL